ncbi:hypothetical protein ABKN59_003251 [Abortiporus biennis]
MMSSTSGTTKNLNDSRVQALQALLNSISSNNGSSSANEGGKLTLEQVRKLSEKLGELLGDDEGNSSLPSDSALRNEKGELLNEEGLPIIDINEPLLPEEATFRPTGSFDDPDVLPSWTLSDEERARRKAERERILDILEEEERTQEERDAIAAKERWKAQLEKRKEAAKTEMDNLKRAKELQKKMGRALIRSVVDQKEEEQKQLAEEEEAEAAKRKASSPKGKKSVSFAGIADSPVEGKGKVVDWGDVVPARLKPTSKTTPLSRADMDRQPMKMDVVERQPGTPRPPLTQTLVVDSSEGDSDDESIPDSNSDDQCPQESDSDTTAHDDDTDRSDHDDEHEEWDPEDFDYAQHQREIALAYYEKRGMISADVSSAMNAHTHEEDEWDQPEVPLDATLASSPPKPPVSRFKATRISDSANAVEPSASTLASHSLGDFIVPSSQSSLLKRSIRMGKVEDGQLYGGEPGESDDELDAADGSAKEILQLLKSGNIANIGPSSNLGASTPSPPVAAPTGSTAVHAEQQNPQPEMPKKSRVSKFKVTLSSQPLSPQSSQPGSSLTTPISLTERSSPKLASPAGDITPTSIPTAGPSSMRPPQIRSTPKSIPPSMIIESPSFLPAQLNGVIESPSFQSTILDPAINSHPLKAPMPPSSRPAAPPIIMSTHVLESRGSNTRNSPHPAAEKKRVSRFKAERM